jgi:DNA-binding NarL/FixJ family response regulator
MSAARKSTELPVAGETFFSPPGVGEANACLTSVAIVERDPAIQKSLRALIDTVPAFRCVAVHSRISDVLCATPDPRPDVMLLDALLLPASATEVITQIKASAPKTRVLLLTTFDLGVRIFDLVLEGVSGDLPKTAPADELARTVRWIRAGGSLMSLAMARRVMAHFERGGGARQQSDLWSRHEREIVAARARGVPYPLIASQLGMEVPGVLALLRGIYDKMADHRLMPSNLSRSDADLPGRLRPHDRIGN